MEVKKKACKGNGKAKGYGCGNPNYIHRYGLCKNCFQEWLFSPDGAETLSKSIITGKKKAKVKERKDFNTKKRESNISSKNFNLYKTTAWKWCSRYVLLYYADSNNIVSCSTSPHLSYHVTDRLIHVGHFIKYRDSNSTNNSTALIFENLAPQSYIDNVKAGGKPDDMRLWLIAKHGTDKIDSLRALKRQAYKLDKYTLFDISEKYKKLFNDLLQKRNITNPWKQ